MFNEAFMQLEENIELYVEINLIVKEHPTLFVCKTINNERYLFYTCNQENYEYIFTKTNNETLIKMLTGEITTKDAFCANVCVYKTYLDFNERFQILKEKDIDNNICINDEEKINNSDETINAYIKKLKNELSDKE